jgi:membrane protein YdbS with pleckstrin-like domain
VPLLLGGWAWWVIGRQVRAWGYAERDEDLLVRHGVMWREIVVVPYGRMQYVDVHAGPIERLFRIAGVQLHTASAASDARIPGLTADEAARLRDRLASRGQARLAGL